MNEKRSAIDTITGYYYQFDLSILKILNCENATDFITIEGIEDIDVSTSDTVNAIQCKYYAKTDYNHSVIANAIRLMIKHYNEEKNTKKIKYNIIGHYKTGHDKLIMPITVEFLKEKFLTFTEKGIKHEVHIELGLKDEELKDFLTYLNVNINAENFLSQQQRIVKKLQSIFNCSEFEAECFFYNNALREIRKIAVMQNINDRKISKQQFINNIDKKNLLFDVWYLEHLGKEKYIKMIKKNYFTVYNITPCERFFIIECDNTITEYDLKNIVIIISEKWSKLSKREATPFCPYICFYGLSQERILKVKELLQTENFYFIDGYCYMGSSFSVKSIIKQANWCNGIKLKLINNFEEVDKIIENISGTKKIFEFHIGLPLYSSEKAEISYIKIKQTNDVIGMI